MTRTQISEKRKSGQFCSFLSYCIFGKKKWCLNSNNTRCLSQCISDGYTDGKIKVDKYVCPFQYFCKCTCPSQTCEKKCALEGKIHVHKGVDIFECDICNCQCRKINCLKTCNRSNFLQVRNTYGCSECKCVCPSVDCDSKCNGTGLAIIKLNQEGCVVCDSCRYQETRGMLNHEIQINS